MTKPSLPPLQLSPRVPLAAMLRSQTAARKGIDNDPRSAEPATADAILAALTRLATDIIEPLWSALGPVAIGSGYRSSALNAAIGSKDSSQHRRGQAVDLEVPGRSNAEVAAWIRDNLAFDQLILEHYTPGQPSSGWVHASLAPADNRRQVLTFDGKTYRPGLVP